MSDEQFPRSLTALSEKYPTPQGLKCDCSISSITNGKVTQEDYEAMSDEDKKKTLEVTYEKWKPLFELGSPLKTDPNYNGK